jgi:ribosomal subunit interface protein
MTRKRPSTGPVPEVQVTVRGGEVPQAVRDYAAEKVGHVATYSHQPVLYAHVVMELVGDPARQRPALGEATLDVNGTPLRAHVAAASLWEAVDMLDARLRRQLTQLEDRLRTRTHRVAVPGEPGWRHGDLPAARPEYFPRPVEDRMVIKRKTFALEPATPEQAVSDMELVGHDFYLFTDLATGQDAVVYVLPDGGYGLRVADGSAPETDAVPLTVVPGPAADMTEGQAVTHLDLGGDPFVFYVDTRTARGRVLYRRYDGNSGLITPA